MTNDQSISLIQLSIIKKYDRLEVSFANNLFGKFMALMLIYTINKVDVCLFPKNRKHSILVAFYPIQKKLYDLSYKLKS